ncbi:unnamed protein product [Prorocentrum cordatum]|uniref:Uncharacterized protein n=1 Tax=Prorocentrum cordatum TaxID=2364126 RepID=A0ABN9RGK2_9DINO|nr:unnamed protein product [Polarella glacialis]
MAPGRGRLAAGSPSASPLAARLGGEGGGGLALSGGGRLCWRSAGGGRCLGAARASRAMYLPMRAARGPQGGTGRRSPRGRGAGSPAGSGRRYSTARVRGRPGAVLLRVVSGCSSGRVA